MGRTRNIKMIIFAMIVVAGILIYGTAKAKRPEYQIMSTIKNSFSDYEDVHLSVQVNVKNYDEEEMLDQIYEHYTSLAGVPDEIQIRIFDGKKGYEAGNERGSKVYYKQ